MEQRELPKWKDKGKLDKALFLGQIVVSIGVLIIVNLDFLGVLKVKNTGLIYEPLMVLMFLAMGLQYRKINKKMMLGMIAVALFITYCIIDVYIHTFG